jgi:succinate dehydrogenase flavoprotein subunit
MKEDFVIHEYDVVIIGGGLTGLRAALECGFSGASVAVVSKVHPLRSHSVAAQGGINASLGHTDSPGHEDSWESHAFDTVKGADYLADQDAVELMCRLAPGTVIQLEHWGTTFSRMDDGRIAQRPFGGAGYPRTCYAADRTGHNILHALFEQLESRDIPVFEEFFVTALVIRERKCVGCTAIRIADGTLHGFSSKAILMATGGFGRLFLRSTNALINTGDGAFLAFKAGVPLKDMEFVQFHPTSLFGTNILITEGARGEGGVLLNRHHDRFMKAYAPGSMELAPRDVVARAIQTEIDEDRGFDGGYVQLDLTGIGGAKIHDRLPGIRQIAIDFGGIDPVSTPIPVQPAQHYSMGGIDVDLRGATVLPGLYAAGECACISVHGANRLGGNSLLETVVFGAGTARTIVEETRSMPAPDQGPVLESLEHEKVRIAELLSREGGEPVSPVRNELRREMFAHFGIFREKETMMEGLTKVKTLQKRFLDISLEHRGSVFNQALVRALELEGMLVLAEIVAKGAIAREESRGSHYRNDFPQRDDVRFLAHTLAVLDGDQIRIAYRPVTMGSFPVKEREY